MYCVCVEPAVYGPPAAGIELRQRPGPLATDKQGKILTPFAVMGDGGAARQRIPGQGLHQIGRGPGSVSRTTEKPLARGARETGNQAAERPLIRFGVHKNIAAEALIGLRVLAGAQTEDDSGYLRPQTIDDEFDKPALTDANERLLDAAQAPTPPPAQNDRGDLFRLQGRAARDNRG